MILRIIAFSKKGIELTGRILEKRDETIEVKAFAKFDSVPDRIEAVENLSDWVEEGFKEKSAIIFVGAMGIAVRMVAPFVKDKLTDSPVIVIDDAGTFVIPLLAGHVGGANKLSEYLAGILNGIPVITTSTDVNGAFSVDTYAMENNLSIVNRDKIKKVSTKAIEGKPVVISIKKYPYENADVIIDTDNYYKAPYKETDSLILRQKKYVLGIGLKKDKDFESVEAFCKEVLQDSQLSFDDIYAIASIDMKINEEALKKLAYKYNMPRIFFDAETLNSIEGDFTSSEFVKNTVGTDNVCERSALAAAGYGGKLLIKKVAREGVTVAVAKLCK